MKSPSKKSETEAIERTHWWLPEAVGEMREGGQKLQMSNSKISHGDVMYSIVSIVNNTVLYTQKFLILFFQSFTVNSPLGYERCQGKVTVRNAECTLFSGTSLAAHVYGRFPSLFSFLIFFLFFFLITSLWDLGSPLSDQTWATGSETVES